MPNNKLIAKNTIFLYLRSIVVMLISIYTSRVVLATLGVDDYGVYNVVGGFVGMFAILSSSMVSASQRFISYEMGKENSRMNAVFCGTVSVHIILTLAILIVFETFGLWFLNTHLNIADDRMSAANWVYQCSVITFSINLICVPYNASIIAHEKMNVFAYISIYEAFAKLIIVYLLSLSMFDELVLYAILLVLVSSSLALIYVVYCRRKFEECNYKFVLEKGFTKSLVSFTSWTFLGSTASILVTQGINVLINIFFGVALNAARGVAEQINNAIFQFISNFMTAMNPQITKSYAANDFEYMNSLMIKGAKYSTLLFWFVALTVFIQADFILSVWLVEVPPYAPIFLRLAIIYNVFQSLSYSLYIGMLATGKVKTYQICMSLLYLLSFVLSYVLFKCGFGPEWGYISTIIALFLAMFLRLCLLKRMIPDFSIGAFFKETICKSFAVIFISTAVCYVVVGQICCLEWLRFIVALVISLSSVALIAYCVALNSDERKYLKLILTKICCKFAGKRN